VFGIMEVVVVIGIIESWLLIIMVGGVGFVGSIESVITGVVESCWLVFRIVVSIIGFINSIESDKSGIIESS